MKTRSGTKAKQINQGLSAVDTANSSRQAILATNCASSERRLGLQLAVAFLPRGETTSHCAAVDPLNQAADGVASAAICFWKVGGAAGTTFCYLSTSQTQWVFICFRSLTLNSAENCLLTGKPKNQWTITMLKIKILKHQSMTEWSDIANSWLWKNIFWGKCKLWICDMEETDRRKLLAQENLLKLRKLVIGPLQSKVTTQPSHSKTWPTDVAQLLSARCHSTVRLGAIVFTLAWLH